MNREVSPAASGSPVVIQPVSMDAVEEFHAAIVESRPELRRYLEWAVPEPEVATTRRNMEQAMANFDAREKELRFLLRRSMDGLLVGCIGLMVRDIEVPFFEIGYWVRSSQAGRGYATGAVRLVEQYALAQFQPIRLEIRCASVNVASARVAQKAGFSHEARIACDRRLPDGELVDTEIFRKLYA